MIIVDILSQSSSTGFTACQKMTIAIATTIKSKGKCKPTDLLDQHFSHEEIERCWNMAECFARFDMAEA